MLAKRFGVSGWKIELAAYRLQFIYTALMKEQVLNQNNITKGMKKSTCLKTTAKLNH